MLGTGAGRWIATHGAAPAPSGAPASVAADTTSTDGIEYPRTVRIEYGRQPQQFGDLTLPDLERAPLVVLIHGGFWRNRYDLTLMEPLAHDLVDRGCAVWNLEYRRLGDDGGGWPGTLEDVAAGIDALTVVAHDHPIDLARVGFVGHSAGGHLAMWAAGRRALPGDAPGSGAAGVPVVPVVAIGQGAVVDLEGAAAAGLGSGAVVELLGGTPAEVPERYDSARPRLDAGPMMVSVVGRDDDIVPPPFSVAPEAPGAIELFEIVGADHFDLIDPQHEAWTAVVDRIDAALTAGAD